MPYPVKHSNLDWREALDEEEYRHFISVWQTSRNTKHALRRLRDDPDFYDTCTRYTYSYTRTYEAQLDIRWLQGHARRLKNMGVPLKKLKTPASDRDLELNTDGLKNLAMSLGS